MDYPDLSAPDDFATITAREAPAILAPLQSFGPEVRVDQGALHLGPWNQAPTPDGSVW
jgi:hypothetical protein